MTASSEVMKGSGCLTRENSFRPQPSPWKVPAVLQNKYISLNLLCSELSTWKEERSLNFPVTINWKAPIQAK